MQVQVQKNPASPAKLSNKTTKASAKRSHKWFYLPTTSKRERIGRRKPKTSPNKKFWYWFNSSEVRSRYDPNVYVDYVSTNPAVSHRFKLAALQRRLQQGQYSHLIRYKRIIKFGGMLFLRYRGRVQYMGVRPEGILKRLKRTLSSVERASNVWERVGGTFEETEVIAAVEQAASGAGALGKILGVTPQMEDEEDTKDPMSLIYKWLGNGKLISLFIGLSAVSNLTAVVYHVYKLLKEIFKGIGCLIGKFKEGGKKARGEAPGEEDGKSICKVLISLIVSGIMAYLGLKFAARKYVSAEFVDASASKLYVLCSGFLSAERNVNRFVSSIFDWFGDIFTVVVMKTFDSDKYSLLKKIKDQKSSLAAWIRDLNELERYGVRARIPYEPELTNRVIIASVYADMVSENLAVLGNVFPELKDARCSGIQKYIALARSLKSDLDRDVACGVNRAPPLNVLFTGASNVGKTSLVKSFAERTLTRAHLGTSGGVCGPNDVYVRACGMPFWNGVTPSVRAVIYDEVLNWQNSTDAGLLNYLNETFSLVGSTVFNVNMAELGDKKTCIAPQMLLQTCNKFVCPAINKAISNSEAFWRRFSHIVKVEMKPDIGVVSTAQRAVFSHLQFRVMVHKRTEMPTEADLMECTPLSYDEFCTYMTQQLLDKQRDDLEWRQAQEAQLRKDMEGSFNADGYQFYNSIASRVPELELIFPKEVVEVYSLDSLKRRKAYKIMSKLEKQGVEFVESIRVALSTVNGAAYSAKPAPQMEEEDMTRAILRNEELLEEIQQQVHESLPLPLQTVSELRREECSVDDDSSSEDDDSEVAGPSVPDTSMRKQCVIDSTTSLVVHDPGMYKHVTHQSVVSGTAEVGDAKCVHRDILRLMALRVLLQPTLEGDTLVAGLRTNALVALRPSLCKSTRAGNFAAKGVRKWLSLTARSEYDSELRLKLVKCSDNCVCLPENVKEYFCLWSKCEGVFPDWTDVAKRYPASIVRYFETQTPMVPDSNPYQSTVEEVEEVTRPWYKRLFRALISKRAWILYGVLAVASLSTFIIVKALGGRVQPTEYWKSLRSRWCKKKAEDGLTFEDVPQPEAYSGADSRTVAAGVRTGLKSVVTAPTMVTAQAGIGDESCQQKILRNMAKLEYITSAGVEKRGMILFLGGVTALVPRHYIDEWEANPDLVSLRLRWSNRQHLIVDRILREGSFNVFSLLKVSYIAEMPSMCVVSFPSGSIPNFRKLVNHFLPLDQARAISSRGILLSLNIRPDSVVAVPVVRASDIRVTGSVRVDKTADYQGFFVSTAVEHGYSALGLCGSVLLDERTGMIVGMHVAGIAPTSRGFCELIVRESVSAMLAHLDMEQVPEPPDDEQLTEVDSFMKLIMPESVPKPEPQMESVPAPSEVSSLGVGAVEVSEHPEEVASSMGEFASPLRDEGQSSLQSITSRYVVVETVPWKTTSTSGVNLAEIDLVPSLLKVCGNYPQFALMTSHRYARFDLEVKVLINSNVRQSGCALVSWAYASTMDPNFQMYKNNFRTRVQGIHAFIQASQSDSVVMNIDYRWIKDWLDISSHQKYSWSSFGKLYIHVINALKVADGATASCNLTVLVGLKNITFKAPMDRRVVRPEMLSAAALALQLMKTYRKNRDRPTSSAEPSFVKTTPYNNMAIGNGGAESIFPLRLQSAMLPHRGEGVETTKEFLRGIFGYVTTLKWDESLASGSTFASIAMVPWQLDNAGVPIPISFLAGLDSFFRGDLLVKMQFVCPVELTGRLLVALLFREVADLSIEKAYASPHVLVDVASCKEIVIRIPFVADVDFWPTQKVLYEKRVAPSFLHVFVLNPLINNLSIGTEVSINIYMAGADNFETIVPRTVNIWPKYATGSFGKDGTLPLKPGYFPIEVGSWHSSPKVGMAMLRYGPGSDHVAQGLISSTDKDVIHGQFWTLDLNAEAKFQYRNSKNELANVYGVLFFKVSSYYYIVAYKDQSALYADSVLAAKGSPLVNWAKVADGATDGPRWAPALPKGQLYYTVKTAITFGDSVVVDGAQAQAPIELLPAVRSSDWGRLHTGERHGDLKDYARRYSLAFSFKAKLAIGGLYPLFKFPALPQGGLIWPTVDGAPAASKSVDLLELLASGYAFVRGGLRYKIVFQCKKQLEVYVMHNPEERPIDAHVQQCFSSPSFQLSNMLQCGCATSVFKTPSVEFEIPQYAGVDRHLASSLSTGTNDQYQMYRSLGMIYVGIMNNIDNQNVTAHVFVAAADDWSLDTFQGLPVLKTRAGPAGNGFVSGERRFISLRERMPTTSSFEEVEEGARSEGEPCFEYLGRVVPGLEIAIPTKSRFEPTRFQGPLREATKEPAILSAKDARWKHPGTPLQAGVAYHLDPLYALAESEVKSVVADYRNLIFSECAPQSATPRVMSLEEVVIGRPGVHGFPGLDMSTSSGFMFKALNIGGKHGLLTIKGGRLVGIHPLLQRAMFLENKSRRAGKCWPTVFVDCLKDELLPKEKVQDKGKTRVFSMSPLSYTLTTKMLFQEFVTAYQYCRSDLEHQVGVNPDSEEWGRLASELELFSPERAVLEGDYKKFGDRLPSQFVMAAYDIIIEWSKKYIPNFPEIVARCVAHESAFAYHLAGDKIYRTLCGQPSGNPLTVVINSMVNSMLVRWSWLQVTRGTELFGMDRFRQHVRLVTYGDDLLATVPKALVSIFNIRTMAKAFSEIGLIFTDSAKGQELIPFVSAEDATFLKRHFSVHPIAEYRRLGIMLAPLEPRSIYECALWRPKGFNETIDLQMVQDSLRLAFSQGPEFYSAYAGEIIKTTSSLGCRIAFPEWEQLNERVYLCGERIFDISKGIVI
nr:MAG: polyprotein [Jingmen bat iflavirus 6]